MESSKSLYPTTLNYQAYFFSQPGYMKASPFLPIFILFFFLCCSSAEQGDPTQSILKVHEFWNRTQQWNSHSHNWTNLQQTQMKLSAPMLIAGVLCFIASSISSAGGIGGGGLFIPIMTIVAGLDLKAASSFSAFMVTGGSLANIICNLFLKNSKYGGKCLIDYDIALLSEPCMLLGVGIGVICNLSFPEWLITVLFASFLAWSTFKTCTNGVLYWKLETEEMNVFEELENGSVSCHGSIKEPLIASSELCFPWKKVGILVLIWFSFFAIYLVRGNRYGESVIPIEPCGAGYWILSSFQIPLAVAFTLWILFRKERLHQYQNTPNPEDTASNVIIAQPINKLIFPIMALLAGGLGGVFGIGGGMLISPLLLHVGIAPEVTAATCSFMVFFSSTMSSLQYLLLGMEQTETALILSLVCFFASLLGLVIVQRAIKEYGRASLIVFSVSIVMVLSTVLMTGFGAVHVWQDYVSGKYMGFKSPC